MHTHQIAEEGYFCRRQPGTAVAADPSVIIALLFQVNLSSTCSATPIVKAQEEGRSSSPGPDRTPPRHDSPQGSRTARDSRHHHHQPSLLPSSLHSRPVAAQVRRGARTLPSPSIPLPLASHKRRDEKSIAEHAAAADRANKNCPPFLLPRSRRRLLSFLPLSPAPRILHYPPRASLSDPSPPRFLLPALAGRSSPARPIPPRGSSPLGRFSFVPIRCASSPAASALARRRPSAAGRVGFPSTDVFAGREVPPTSTVSSAAACSSGAGPGAERRSARAWIAFVVLLALRWGRH